MTEIARYAAFTTDPTLGNPAGVVLNAELTDTEMQAIAADIGYSETAFATSAGGGKYALRFFSPFAEVAFCGHATIATAIALAERGEIDTLEFDTLAGPISIELATLNHRDIATLTSVDTFSTVVTDDILAEALAALGWELGDLDPRFPAHVAFAGNNHLVLAAGSRERLAALDYDFEVLELLMERESWTTVQLFYPESETVVHSRNPFPIGGVVEDPATGAAAAALGGYLREIGDVPKDREITIIQGEDMGRRSELLLTVSPDSARVRVSGTAVRIP